MANTWSEIVNIGLAALGTVPIASIDEESTNGRRAKSIYRQVIDEVTTEHPWYCAKVRQDLAPLSTPPGGLMWHYQYQLPVSPRFLAIVGVDPDTPYEIEGSVLLSNEDAITLIYTSEILDPKVVPPKLAYAMGMRFADLFSFWTIQRDAKQQWDAQIYRVALLEAKQADSRRKRRTEDQVVGSENKERLDEVG